VLENVILFSSGFDDGPALSSPDPCLQRCHGFKHATALSDAMRFSSAALSFVASRHDRYDGGNQHWIGGPGN